MDIRKLFLGFLVLMVPSMSLQAAEKMRVAVVDLKADGVPARTARTVSDMIRTDMVNTGRFTVIERAQMDAIMKEQGLQMTGCTDQDCAVQVGKIVSARKILVGSVSPLGTAIVINVRIVDVEKGLVDYAAREKAASEATLDTAVSLLTKNLSGRIAGDHRMKEGRSSGTVPMTGYYLRSIVPGWGQFYAGETWKGYAFSGAFAAAAAFSIYAIVNYGKKKKAYDDLSYGDPDSEFDSKFDEYKKAGNVAFISFGIVGAVYLAHWVDILFFTGPDYGSRNAGKRAGDVHLDLYTDAGSVQLPERRTLLSVSMRF
jgi:hypothetical protein